jgi:VPDSG-CTERM motif
MVMAALALAPAVMAQSVTLYQTPYSFGSGGVYAGEFGAQVTGGGSFAPPFTTAGYSTLAEYNGNFETFCVETTVDVNWNLAYNLNLGLTALGSQNPASPFPLTVGAAYLYNQFAQGLLSDYNYANNGTGNSRVTDAGLLQAALWYFEGGQSYTGWPAGGNASNPYYTDALNYVTGLGYTAAELTAAVSGEGQFGVEIMNLTATSGGAAAQNQLVYLGGGTGLTHEEPVPDGGATLGLLGLGLAGLAVFSRRFGGA